MLAAAAGPAMWLLSAGVAVELKMTWAGEQFPRLARARLQALNKATGRGRGGALWAPLL